MNRTRITLPLAVALAAGCATTARTPLHDPVWDHSSVDAIQAIIHEGVDVNAYDPAGRTALMYAAMRAQDPKVIRILLAAGANVDAMSRADLANARLNPRDLILARPLHFAAKHNGNPRIVSALLDAGAEANEPDWFGNRPLHLAVRYNHRSPAVIAALLDGGADRRIHDDNGETAFEVARSLGVVVAIEGAGVDLAPPVVTASQNPDGDVTGKWIAGALIAGLLASQADVVPTETLVEIGTAAAIDLIEETGGDNLRRLSEEARREAPASAAVLAETTRDGIRAAQDPDEVIGQIEGQCDGAKYRGSRNPNNHNTTFQCAAAFALECNLGRASNEGRSAEWIAAAKQHLRTQCELIAELQETGVMGACPHCSSTAHDAGCVGA